MVRKVVAITGAYSGLGAALTRRFHAQGYAVFLGGKDLQKLNRFAQSLGSEIGTMAMDVRRKQDCEQFISTAVVKFGRLDILVNNAAVLLSLAGIDTMTETELRDTFDINVF